MKRRRRCRRRAGRMRCQCQHPKKRRFPATRRARDFRRMKRRIHRQRRNKVPWAGRTKRRGRKWREKREKKQEFSFDIDTLNDYPMDPLVIILLYLITASAIAPISIITPYIIVLLCFIIGFAFAAITTAPVCTCIAVCTVGNPTFRRRVAIAIRAITQLVADIMHRPRAHHHHSTSTTKFIKYDYQRRIYPRVLWTVVLMIIIVPTVCASGDYDNQLPSSAASTAAAAVVHMLCPSLIQ